MRDPWWLIVGGVLVGSVSGAISGLLIRYWWDGAGGAQTRSAAASVRRWWNSGRSSQPSSIKMIGKHGEIKIVRPVRACGLHLVVEPLTQGKTRTWEMMSASQAENTDEFWRTWKWFGGKLQGWVDEDGDEFVP